MFCQDEQIALNLHGLANETDIRPLVLRTLLTYLELNGYLQGGTPFYTEYQFQPRQSSRAILERFQGERRDFLTGIFRQARRGRTWFRLDIEAAATTLGSPRERIVRALDWLAEQGLFEVRTSGLRYRYRISAPTRVQPGTGR